MMLAVLATAVLGVFFPPVRVAGKVADEIVHVRLTMAGNRVFDAKSAVAHFAEMYGADVNLALCIVRLESGFNHLAKNKGSSAGGAWQFIDSTWVSTVRRMGKDWTMADKYDMMKNAEAGAWLLAHDGYTHWVVWPSCVKNDMMR